MIKKLLVVVDMQNDFVTGVLGSKDAGAIVPAVMGRVKEAVNAGEDIVFTRDTHHDDYMDTKEGKYLPVPHCIESTPGWEIIDELKPYAEKIINKPTFGSTDLIGFVAAGDYDEIELIGLCTDICVVSNALLLKANFPEKTYRVNASCCAGITKESHEAALLTMKMCHIEIMNE